MTSRARLTILLLALVSGVLRAVAFFRYRFDSDEPQHLHVAWGWTAGLLQYRDVFDNHAPLFHMVTAPILKAVGERDDVLLYMRAPMLILFAVVIAATYLLGARLYSRSVGAWSAVLVSLLPPFFLKSLEYRTDNLWNALWFLSLMVLTGGTLTALRLFTVGLLLGLAFATSLKTSLLVLTLGAAAWMTALATRRFRMNVIWPLLAGIPIAPAIIVAYFVHRGALHNLLYCAIEFNELLTRTRSPLSIWLPRMMWLPLMVIAVRVAWRYRPHADDAHAHWRYFFAFGTAFFIVTLFGFWILVSPRDLLPCLSFLVIFGVAYVDRKAKHAMLIYVAAAALFVALIAHYTEGFANGTREYTTMMHQVLRLTRPGEPVMDLKGETIYRPRPYYFIFEFITRNAMRRGLIRDTIPEDVVRAQCHVAQADGEFFPARGRAFLNANFLDMGRMRAAGKWIDVHASFTIAVPGWYVIVNRRGEVKGQLDGIRYSGSRYLAAGTHVFDTESKVRPIACLWAPAWQRGFTPFKLQDRDF